jgi:hypothetical protein
MLAIRCGQLGELAALVALPALLPLLLLLLLLLLLRLGRLEELLLLWRCVLGALCVKVMHVRHRQQHRKVARHVG